jgi:hypothetical protein
VDWAGAVHGLVDSVHGFSFRKTIPGKSNFGHFALRPLGFFKINPQSMDLQSDLGVWKIIPKRFLASEKSTKIALKLQNSVSFEPQLQI